MSIFVSLYYQTAEPKLHLTELSRFSCARTLIHPVSRHLRVVHSARYSSQENANNARFQRSLKLRAAFGLSSSLRTQTTIPVLKTWLHNSKKCRLDNDLDRVTIALESTSFCSVHIANYLSACDEFLPFHPMVYCLNPKTTARYKETFVDMDKTDPLDALAIADFARAQKIATEPWRGAQFWLSNA